MTRSSPWGILLVAICACNGGGNRDNNNDKPPELTQLEPVDADGDSVLSDTDCNDGDANIFPGATETCNGLDDDCNGVVDDDLMVTYYRDADGDTYGDPNHSATACSQPNGFVTDDTDCDDSNRYVQPGGIEVCDLLGVDEDCDGLANDDDPKAEGKRIWYVDGDEDGYGSTATVESCFEAPGLASVGTDCNDADYDINPGTPEVCDPLDKDEDCDGFSDAADPEGPDGQPLYYVDLDADGDGDMSDPGQYFCDGVPPGYSTSATDCDDSDMLINPRAPENCRDLIDNDCNGAVDDCGPIPDIGLDTSDTILAATGSYAYHGSAVAGIGDMNGDGQADFATSAYYWDSGYGAAFVYYGPMSSGEYDPEDVADSMIEGTTMYGYFGYSLDKAGDVNNDGYDDLIVGTESYNDGNAYIFLGPLLGDTSPSGADATWSGENASDYAGQAVAGGFDFDADGNDDYMIGAAYADSYSGAVYLVYGPGTGANDLGDASVKISGPSYTYLSGWGNGTLTEVPDMDGDGADEMAIGHSYGSSYSGAVYLFYGGSLSGDYTTSDADVTYTSSGSYDYDLGYRVGHATDYNGDGLGDVMMGAYATSTGGYYSGSAYVVAGPGDTGGNVDSVALVEFYGEASYQYIGQYDMDGEGDVNSDGFSDVVIGAAQASGGGATYVGSAYVVYGPQSGDVSLGNARCQLYGTTMYGYAGQAVSFIGDQSGDDSPEVLVGAPYDSSYAGAAYIVWGDRL